MSVATSDLALGGDLRQSPVRRLSTFLYRHGGLFTLILLAPPLAWLGIVYLGSLFALLAQSFFSFDDFSGQVIYEFTLRSYVELLTSRANLDIILRTVAMAAAVTVRRRADRLPDRLHDGPPCQRAHQGAVLSRGDAAAVVQLPGPGLCLEADPGQGGHRQLGVRRGQARLAARRRARLAGDRRAVALGLLSRHVPGVHLHLAAVHDPADPGGAGARAQGADRGLGRPRRTAVHDAFAP